MSKEPDVKDWALRFAVELWPVLVPLVIIGILVLCGNGSGCQCHIQITSTPTPESP